MHMACHLSVPWRHDYGGLIPAWTSLFSTQGMNPSLKFQNFGAKTTSVNSFQDLVMKRQPYGQYDL